MSIFYIDLEYTNSNLYIGEVFEIAVLSEKSGYMFHVYISITDKIPPFVKELCGVDDIKLVKEGISFTSAMYKLETFIRDETDENPFIISHGNRDSQILFANL